MAKAGEITVFRKILRNLRGKILAAVFEAGVAFCLVREQFIMQKQGKICFRDSVMDFRIRLPDRKYLCRNLGDEDRIPQEKIQRILMHPGCLTECGCRRVASGIRRKLWTVIAFSVSQNRNRCNGTVTADQRLTVLNPENIVWKKHCFRRIL